MSVGSSDLQTFRFDYFPSCNILISFQSSGIFFFDNLNFIKNRNC